MKLSADEISDRIKNLSKNIDEYNEILSVENIDLATIVVREAVASMESQLSSTELRIRQIESVAYSEMDSDDLDEIEYQKRHASSIKRAMRYWSHVGKDIRTAKLAPRGALLDTILDLTDLLYASNIETSQFEDIILNDATGLTVGSYYGQQGK